MSKFRCPGLSRAGVLLLALLVSLLPGSPASAASTVVSAGNGFCRDIAFTYDNAYYNTATTDLLNTLDDGRIRATFFLVGNTVGDNPATVRRIAATHAVGNHTQTHPHMPDLSAAQMRAELDQAEAAILSIAGVDPQPWWRPPYGEYNGTVLTVAGDAGYAYTVMWSTDTIDWQYPPPETIRRRIVDRASPGDIVLMHGYLAGTVEGTRLAAGDLRQMGYQFVTVPEILGFGRDQRDFGGDTYVVQSGDNMGHIGECHNVSGPRLQAYNQRVTVPPGTVLRIPHTDEVIITVDGIRQSFPVYPRLLGNRTVAHVRLAERLGAAVAWDGTQVIITRDTTRIAITPGQRTARVNGVPVDMGAAAFMENNRVLAPVRFLAEQLNAAVSWEGTTWTVAITP